MNFKKSNKWIIKIKEISCVPVYVVLANLAAKFLIDKIKFSTANFLKIEIYEFAKKNITVNNMKQGQIQATNRLGYKKGHNFCLNYVIIQAFKEITPFCDPALSLFSKTVNKCLNYMLHLQLMGRLKSVSLAI